ncbi:uncharacterized protein LOC121987072 [Zingiber officinale]|uniref:uncharacterized protein LOC121987072 n=1 Tax=Zingiber officinale TaxID=94328 RepID=UPI001C4B5F3E|nr:uncharacterized protein LOC121987072 [Zingiber officinale]
MEGSPRRIGSASASSPEFEFWAVADPPPPPLLTADELFADGVLLPLHHLSLRPHLDSEIDAPRGRPKSKPDPDPASPLPRPPPTAELTASISCSPTTGSKRWKDIFRVGEKKPAEEKERRKDRKGGDGGAVAELNINIWPFSRSRSAGSAVRPPASASGRRASSAPCSRSNSRGESSKHHNASAAPGGRRWAASPGRPGGVLVGRASPVWQIRRPEQRERDKITASGRKANAGAGARMLNTGIGYRGGQRNCGGDDKNGVTARERTGRGLFSLMALFSKKVH